MASDTTIEWADKTWSPIIGCDRVSPGCDNCYAIGTARIREGNPHPKVAAAFAGTTERNEDGLDWTGKVNLLHDRLDQPLHWKKPRKIFVNSLSDLFHDAVPDEFIAQVFARMWWSPQHTFQVLTKRHGRMRSIMPRIEERLRKIERDLELVDVPTPLTWPLPNVWLGVSVENQRWADIRIPALLDTQAAVRFLSCEPLLGAVDLTSVDGMNVLRGDDTGYENGLHWVDGPIINWVIVGGESGRGARPMHPDWARTIRNQCVQADVPFLFKQWGEWGVDFVTGPDGRIGPHGKDITVANDGTVYEPGDLAYPDGPRYGEAVRADHGRAHLTAMYRLGKKRAGRELDGRTWDQFPEVTTC